VKSWLMSGGVAAELDRRIAAALKATAGSIGPMGDAVRRARQGRSTGARLIEQCGREGKLTDWLGEIAADCPKRLANKWADRCQAQCPDLPRVM
jgi:hypothetical protein